MAPGPTRQRGLLVFFSDFTNSCNPWIYHPKTIWLFTLSDLKTIVGPATIFGIVNALCAPIFGIRPAPNTRILNTIAITSFWTWINLLPFAIDNQRQAGAIKEDILNKPWRPLPSQRLTPPQAKKLMLLLYPLALCTSVLYGSWRQCLILMALGYWYNDRGGAEGCVTRNFINACGFVCYASGAMEVALGNALPQNAALFQWFLVIAGVVFSTVQTQDMYDQAGDLARGRRTLPLVLGDWQSRVMTALPMLFWSFFCPRYWVTSLSISLMFAVTGSVIVARMLLLRDVWSDKVTFKIWNAWMVLLYLLPITTYAVW